MLLCRLLTTNMCVLYVITSILILLRYLYTMYRIAYVINNWVMKSRERVQAFVWWNIWETVTEKPDYHGCFWEPHWISMVSPEIYSVT